MEEDESDESETEGRVAAYLVWTAASSLVRTSDRQVNCCCPQRSEGGEDVCLYMILFVLSGSEESFWSITAQVSCCFLLGMQSMSYGGRN